ncbi:MAG: M23 family metallopeptidase [Clostridiales Family XIII bacterium]|jgi:murein DD-endopeptidase MepM/ murein hydrolase activator NlpD|nr:M23 family metallopeptidase [Clostridiales Family XIII bacterium]
MSKPDFMSIFQKVRGRFRGFAMLAVPKPEDFDAPGTSFAVDKAIDRLFAFFEAVAKAPASAGINARRLGRRAARRTAVARSRAERAVSVSLSASAIRVSAFMTLHVLSRLAPPLRVIGRAVMTVVRAVSRVTGAAARAVSARMSAGAEAIFERFCRAVERENKFALCILRFIKFVWIAKNKLRARLFACGVLYRTAAKSAFTGVRASSSAFAASCKAGMLVFARAMNRAWRLLCLFSDVHKKSVLATLAVCLVLSVCAVSAVNHYSAYEYMYNGKPLGVVNDKKTVYSAVRLVGDKLSQAYNAEINIDENRDISFRRVFGVETRVDSPDDVLNSLTYMKDMKVKGYTIVADGKSIATFDSKATVENFLADIQAQFLSDGGNGGNYTDVDFSENIQISEIDTKLAYLKKPEDIFDYVMTGAVEQRYHAVEKGQTLSGIAVMYGLGLSELMNMNPDVVPERLQIGQQLKLERVVPLLTVKTTEVATYIEEVPFDIAYENSSAMFKGEQTVRLTGTKGERQVTAEIIKENGVETGKNELESVTLLQPAAQVVLVGTKDPPPLIGTGTFQYPTRGRLTSRFGTRWGRMHNGIDLAASSGTAIRAADGGKVTFAGWGGSLGYLVKIDHGGNRETWYGHCSKLLVSAGDHVYQGQHIANVGSTGRSTGAHLHFEVHVNGVAKNPLNYL